MQVKCIFLCTSLLYSQDQTGFQLISSSFSGGRISCIFIRSVIAANPAEDRNLNEAAFVLLAIGSTRGKYFCAWIFTDRFLFTIAVVYVIVIVLIVCNAMPNFMLLEP